MGGADQNNGTVRMKKKNGSIRSIFMHADGQDWFLMILGFLGAMGDGFTIPLVLYLTSKIMNNIGGSSNMVGSSFIHNMNKVFFLSLSPSLLTLTSSIWT